MLCPLMLTKHKVFFKMIKIKNVEVDREGLSSEEQNVSGNAEKCCYEKNKEYFRYQSNKSRH